MSDLVEFLLARIAEDEEAARAAVDQGTPRWAVGGGGEYVHPDPPPGNSYVATGPWGGGLGPAADHIARHDPARVLAECEAKRRIVEWMSAWQQDVAVEGLRLVALPYADHPDYRDEWRVG